MIDHAMAGKFNMVITKSVSRFARNLMDCVKYVNEVTYNPYLLSVVTILICVEVSVLIAIFSFRGKSPVQMFAEGKPRRRRFHRAKAAGRYRSWKWLLVRRIKLRNLLKKSRSQVRDFSYFNFASNLSKRALSSLFSFCPSARALLTCSCSCPITLAAD